MTTLADRLRHEAAVSAETRPDDSDIPVMLEAADALDRCGWRPFKTAPNDRTRVLVSYGGRAEISHSGKFDWEATGWTHWMPLPPPPGTAP